MSIPARLACDCISRAVPTAPGNTAAEAERSTLSLSSPALRRKTSLLRIVCVDRARLRRIFDGGSYGIVIARGPIRTDLIHNLLAINRPFQCRANINVVEGRLSYDHWRDVVQEPGDVVYVQIGVCFSKSTVLNSNRLIWCTSFVKSAVFRAVGSTMDSNSTSSKCGRSEK